MSAAGLAAANASAKSGRGATDPDGCVRAPYPLPTYAAALAWRIVQATAWRLAWKRLTFLRASMLRCFRARVPCRVLISEGVRIQFPWMLGLGEHVAIGPRVTLYNLGGIRIGDRVVISQDAYLCGGTHDHRIPTYPLLRLPITIEDDVWIGAGAYIGPGVTVGRGAVVGARAVVAKDVPAWKVVAGNPARVIKDRVLR